MPCRNDYIRMVKLSIQRNLKEQFSFRANDFEISITEKNPNSEGRIPYIAIFDMNDLLRNIKCGSILNCECVEKKHKMSEFLKR